MLLVKKLRLQKGWSQAELAEFSGLSIRTIQRVEKGETPGLETLKSLAAVFDIDITDFRQENKMDDKKISVDEHRAFKQVQREKNFYKHLVTYICVVGMLFIGNLLFSPGYIWAKWPAMGWGAAVAAQAVKVFIPFKFFGPEWEKKQIEKKLGRKL